MSEIAKPRGIRALYAWMLKNASGRHAWVALACFAFAEASCFPIPPDVMLLPMMVADRRNAFKLGLWCAFWSVMGGMLGYAIGHLFWETAGLWLIGVLHLPLEKVASGLASVPFALFMTYSAIVRSFRFVVLEGLLVHFFGDQAKAILDKYLEVALMVFLVAVVLGFVALRYL
jgi:membrane protein YqaA with SNARE-associated domain